jgi:hypothetical protein
MAVEPRPVIGRLQSRLWAALLLLLVSGCGSEDYQDRLDTTSRYFASLELQDSNLHGAWTDAATTISLRVPKQFAELPGPAPAPTDGSANTESQDEEEGPDPRQPGFLTVPLPGLRAAFRANVSVVGDNGRSANGAGYLYVLSNHHLAGNLEMAAKFESETIDLLAAALNEVELEPEEQPDEMAREFGVATRFSLYSHADGDVQVILLWVLPRDLDTSEKMAVRRPLCLESLKIGQPQLLLPKEPGQMSNGTQGAF